MVLEGRPQDGWERHSPGHARSPWPRSGVSDLIARTLVAVGTDVSPSLQWAQDQPPGGSCASERLQHSPRDGGRGPWAGHRIDPSLALRILVSKASPAPPTGLPALGSTVLEAGRRGPVHSLLLIPCFASAFVSPHVGVFLPRSSPDSTVAPSYRPAFGRGSVMDSPASQNLINVCQESATCLACVKSGSSEMNKMCGCCPQIIQSDGRRLICKQGVSEAHSWADVALHSKKGHGPVASLPSRLPFGTVYRLMMGDDG